MPPGVLIEMSGGVPADRGGDQARVVRPQRVLDQRERGSGGYVAQVRQREQDRAALAAVPWV